MAQALGSLARVCPVLWEPWEAMGGFEVKDSHDRMCVFEGSPEEGLVKMFSGKSENLSVRPFSLSLYSEFFLL